MFKPVNLLFRLDKGLSHLEGFLLVSILLIALGFSFLQVVLRNFFDSGITWGDVFGRHLVLWIGFFGATLSTQTDTHIKIDALTKVLPPRALPIVEFFIYIFCIIVGGLLFNSAYTFVVGEKAAMTTLFKGIPTWYFIVIMPVGFAIITFRYCLKVIDLLYKIGGKKIDWAKKTHEPSWVDISLKIKLK